jgi:VWFA-related protein
MTHVLPVVVVGWVLLSLPQGVHSERPGRDVVLHVTATSPEGRIVTNLTPADIEVIDEGTPAHVISVEPAPAAVRAAVIVDQSSSMRVSKSRFVQDMRILGSHLRAGDSLHLLKMAGTVQSVGSATDADAWVQLVTSSFGPDGSTPLWDALAEGMLSQAAEGRRVIIAFTDGRANGNFHSATTVMERALAGGYLLYFVSPPDNVGLDAPGMLRPGTILDQAAAATGGLHVALTDTRTEAFRGAVSRIFQELRGQYVVTFRSDVAAGEFRSLDLRASRPGVVLRARTAYESRIPNPNPESSNPANPRNPMIPASLPLTAQPFQFSPYSRELCGDSEDSEEPEDSGDSGIRGIGGFGGFRIRDS